MSTRQDARRMKSLYLIGGTMGVGKTAVCQQLKKDLPDCVFLDGDWCWDASPFQVTDETKAMVLGNIRYLLNSFLRCTAYENVVFCWVMDRQEIWDAILSGLDTADCRVVRCALTAGEESLRRRLERDIARGIRTADIVERSIERLPLYRRLDVPCLDTDGKRVAEIAAELRALAEKT